MYTPVGLEPWEIVAASGLCAVAFLSVATLIGAAIAVFVTRQPAPVRAPARAEYAPTMQPVPVGRVAVAG